jgi:glucose-6-phosphate 1-dehydrogenase
MYNVAKGGSLPESFGLIGVSSREANPESLRESIEKLRKIQIDEKVWSFLAPRLAHVAGRSDDAETFARLKQQLEDFDAKLGTQGNRLYYLSTPPSTFTSILSGLKESGLIYPTRGEAGEKPWSRVIIEKPFGHDLESALELNGLASRSLHESQIYRIDHYLGKETVQNLQVFRFGNGIFEPLWNRKFIDHVQITAAEELDVGGRGEFYDNTGVVRDIVQNHLMQVLELTAMEPPASLEADDVRDEKVKVTRSVRRFTPETMLTDVVMGQYKGYREVEGVKKDSRTPTYVAMKVMVDSWRWQGVPFYLRAGKNLTARCTEVSIHFHGVPFNLFGDKPNQRLASNSLTVHIQPKEGISLDFMSKVPGDDVRIAPVHMDFNYDETFETKSPEAYERLILDCMRGDQTLFQRRDDVEEAWRVVDPVLKNWENGSTPIPIYDPGSAGPIEADQMLAHDGRTWRQIK